MYREKSAVLIRFLRRLDGEDLIPGESVWQSAAMGIDPDFYCGIESVTVTQIFSALTAGIGMR